MNEGMTTLEKTYIELKAKLESVDKQLFAHETIMQESPKNTEKQFIEKARLTTLRNQLILQIAEIEKNQQVTDRMAKEDKKFEKTTASISKTESKLDKSRFKFINDMRKSKLDRLKKKKIRIQAKQRKLVNSFLTKKYREFEKFSKTEGRFVGKNDFYEMNINEAVEKLAQSSSKIVNDDKLIHKITNQYYKLSVASAERKKQKFEALKKKNIIRYGGKHSNKLDLAYMKNNLSKLMSEGYHSIKEQDYARQEQDDDIISFQERAAEMAEERSRKAK